MNETPGRIVADSKEKQNEAVLALADEVKFLKVENVDDKAHPWSFDLEVTTKAGQVIRFEAKWSHSDLINSWLDRQDDGHSRLTRQVGYVDALIIVWNEIAIELEEPDKARRSAMKGLKNRLSRMALEANPPVLWFHSVADACDFLRYLKGYGAPISLGRRPAGAPADAVAVPPNPQNP